MLSNLWNKYSKIIIPLLLFLAISLRLHASFTFPAQYYDIGTYEAWGRIMLDKGPSDFFTSTWSDYLPLPIYFCSLIAILSDYFQANYGVVFKLAVSLIEFSLLFLLWRLHRPRSQWLLLPLLFLSPALLGDSAYWGQLDTLPALLTVLSLSLIIPPKPGWSHKTGLNIRAAILFGLAVAIKPILLLTLPVFLIILMTHRPSSIVHFSIISLLTFLLPALPVAGISGAFQFLYTKALEQGSTYPYTTINAWNLWSTQNLHNQWPPDSQSVLGVSAQSLGYFLFGSMALWLINHWRLQKFAPAQAFRVAATLLIVFYTFTTRMHERHLLFGLPFLALAALSNLSLLIPFTLFTFHFTLNLWAAYYWVNHAQTWPVSTVFIQTISWLNVALSLMLAFVWDWQQFAVSVKQWLTKNKILFFILLLAAILRYYKLGNPPTYIFDEVYHSFTARQYLANNIEAWEWWTTPPEGVAFEWTHPPVAKYGMVLGMLLFGENSVGWRVGSAIMGVISIAGIYYLSLALKFPRSTALIAAFLVSIEGLHVAQSRIGMNDIYMLAFLIWSLYNAVKLRWKWSAVLFGLALASKWSAVYGLVPLAFLYLHNHIASFRSFRYTIYEILNTLRLSAIALIVYVLTFIPFLTAGHTWQEWWELHRQMWYYHTHLVATHAYQSTPWQWIFSLRPVWYFVEYGDNIRNIYAQGNPAILWLGLVALLMLLPRIMRFPYTISFMLYATFTLPWLFSPRIMFFYHYLPSATFLSLLLAAWLSQFNPRQRVVVLLVCLLVFAILSPVYYGFPMPALYWDNLFGLFPSWK